MLAGAAAAAPPILVHGHRGAAAVRPENTLPSYAEAIRAGADYIEIDIYATTDDRLLVTHDSSINLNICQGPLGKRSVQTLSFAEARQYDCGSLKNPAFPRQTPVPGTRMPAIEEVFDLAGKHPTVKVNIEIKNPGQRPESRKVEDICRLTAAAIRAARMEKRVLVQSFDFRIVKEMARIAPELELAALYGDGERTYVDIARETGVKMVNPNFKGLTAEKVKAAHDAGIRVIAWTVDQPADWDKVLATGVDGVITNDPESLIAHLKKLGRR
jgi:glycerophosphoryl diester phosphodiesterase